MKTILQAIKAMDETLAGTTIAKALANKVTIAPAIESYEGGGGAAEAALITFDPNNETTEYIVPLAEVIGRTVELPYGTGLTPPSNKKFGGWATSSTATEGFQTLLVEDDTNLYAVWVADE